MKWIQLDSDTPDDPKVRAVTRALGAAGLGGLVGLWCFIAKHGRRPGVGVDSRGAPFPVEHIEEATMLRPEEFAELVELCTRSGHFDRDAWEKHRGIWIPAMERRADRYTRRVTTGQARPWGDA